MMSLARQVVGSNYLRLLALAVILVSGSRPAYPADWLEMLGLSSASGTAPVIVVEASYPGAGAQVVAETVAAPIEQQVNGVEKMRYMRSRCTSQGFYVLQIVFDKRADPDMTQVLVQNRVALAMPLLPPVVQNQGVTARKMSPRPLAIVILRSPDGSKDIHSLSRAVAVSVRDELLRLPGVGQIRSLGESAFDLRILLKPKEMAEHKLTVSDVLTEIRAPKAKPDTGESGQPSAAPRAGPELTTPELGRLAEAEIFGRTVLRSDVGGRAVRLKDVARFDTGCDQASLATLAGKPVVALAVYPLPGVRPQQVIADLRDRLAAMQSWLPRGAAVDASFDFTSGTSNKPAGREYLVIDLPPSGKESADDWHKIILRCHSVLGGIAGIQDVLVLPESPFVALAGPRCLIVRLSPSERGPTAAKKMAASVRLRLAELKETRLRLHDLPLLGDVDSAGYPVDMAVYGQDTDKVKELTARLAAHMRESKKLTDVWADAECKASDELFIDVDRPKALGRGVLPTAIYDTLAALGGTGSDDANSAGKPWQVKIDVGDKPPSNAAMLLVRSQSGELVPLSELASLRMVKTPAVLDRFNLYPMAEATANLAAGVSPAAARGACEAIFKQTRKELGLNEGYRLSWLGR